MTRYITNVYGRIHEVTDVESGEIKFMKEKTGETFDGDAKLYGCVYKICSEAIYKFDPLHCSAMFIYLMNNAELGTNRIDIDYKKLCDDLKCSKDTVYRCLKTFKSTHTIIEYNGYWVINPIIFFKGTYDQRWDLYIDLNKPTFIISPEYFRKEFYDESKKKL